MVLANRPTAADFNQMLSFGATACLSKETQARDVISAIHLAARGLHVLPEETAVHGGDPVRIRGVNLLTPREGEVLEQLQVGATNAEIAERLAIGVETVRTHARKIYRKLGIASRRELARLERQGLVQLETRSRRSDLGRARRRPAGSAPAAAPPPARRWSRRPCGGCRPTIQRLRQRSCEGSRRMRPDQHVVAARRVERQRVEAVGGVVHHAHAGRRGQQLAALLR